MDMFVVATIDSKANPFKISNCIKLFYEEDVALDFIDTKLKKQEESGKRDKQYLMFSREVIEKIS